MSREKQIEEIRSIIETDCEVVCDECDFNGKEHCFIHYCSNALYNAGYRKQSETIRCKDCIYFREYSTEYLREVEKADGDCYIRAMNSNNEQFIACCRDDYCSFAKMRGVWNDKQ